MPLSGLPEHPTGEGGDEEYPIWMPFGFFREVKLHFESEEGVHDQPPSPDHASGNASNLSESFGNAG